MFSLQIHDQMLERTQPNRIKRPNLTQKIANRPVLSIKTSGGIRSLNKNPVLVMFLLSSSGSE